MMEGLQIMTTIIEHIDRIALFAGTHNEESADYEIGRASCRERV